MTGESHPLRKRDQSLADGVRACDRLAIAKAITLVESTLADHRRRAQAVLRALTPQTGQTNTIRIGISGAPGVGKSTFIDALGTWLVAQGKRLAVLAVDPSSTISGGSILGDKTRMERLTQSEAAFIRPSPTSGALGGVTAKTREAIQICEAAGFDIVIVETVGVGQSETLVAGMVDVFVLLQLPNTGDDLQAIKKGIVELADIVVFNKADIDDAATQRAVLQMQTALGMLRSTTPDWKPPVLAASALKDSGIEAFWAEVERYCAQLKASGEFEKKRQRQLLDYMWSRIDAGLREHFHNHPAVRARLDDLCAAVVGGTIAPDAAADILLALNVDGSK